MVGLMRKILLVVAFAGAPSVALASGPIYGPLQAQNALSELGPMAPQARLNLGLGSAATHAATDFDAAGAAAAAQAASYPASNPSGFAPIGTASGTARDAALAITAETNAQNTANTGVTNAAAANTNANSRLLTSSAGPLATQAGANSAAAIAAGLGYTPVSPALSVSNPWAGTGFGYTTAPTPAQLATAAAGQNYSAANVLPTNGTAARALSAWLGDTISIMAYTGADPTGATNSDAAFTAAIAAALARPYGAKIVLPAGNFKLSAAQSIALTAAQSIYFEGAGPGLTTITQTGAADAFDVAIAHYTTKNGQFVGFRNLSLYYTNATPGNAGINVTTAAAGGQQGLPVYIENCAFLGAFNTDFSSVADPTQTYISNSTFYMSSNTTGIYFSGNAATSIYGVDLMLDNDISWNGAAFLNVGPYVQGVIARGINVAAATRAITWTASAGAGEQFILANSYVMSGVYLTVSGTGSLTGVQISNNFFDGPSATTDELNIVGVLEPQVAGNFFFGSPTVGGTALYFGAGASYGVITGNDFAGWEGGSGNGNGLTLDTGANGNLVSQNSALNTTTPAIDNGTSNNWLQNDWDNTFALIGLQGGNARGASAVDLQSVRTAATQVASGASSTTMGSNNTANGPDDTAIGFSNNSTGIGTTAIGYGNSVSGSQSVAMGLSNTVSGTQNTALGIANSATGSYSVVTGSYASDRGRIGANCAASGAIGAVGDAQYCSLLLRTVSTSTSTTRLTSDGNAAAGGNCINIPANQNYTIEATLTGVDETTSGNLASAVGIRGLLYRVGTGNAVWVSGSTGTAQGIGTGASLVPALSVDTTNQCLNFSVTPPNADSWHWDARVQTVEER
jgi:hypothetical protein